MFGRKHCAREVMYIVCTIAIFCPMWAIAQEPATSTRLIGAKVVQLRSEILESRVTVETLTTISELINKANYENTDGTKSELVAELMWMRSFANYSLRRLDQSLNDAEEAASYETKYAMEWNSLVRSDRELFRMLVKIIADAQDCHAVLNTHSKIVKWFSRYDSNDIQCVPVSKMWQRRVVSIYRSSEVDDEYKYEYGMIIMYSISKTGEQHFSKLIVPWARYHKLVVSEDGGTILLTKKLRTKENEIISVVISDAGELEISRRVREPLMNH